MESLSPGKVRINQQSSTGGNQPRSGISLKPPVKQAPPGSSMVVSMPKLLEEFESVRQSFARYPDLKAYKLELDGPVGAATDRKKMAEARKKLAEARKLVAKTLVEQETAAIEWEEASKEAAATIEEWQKVRTPWVKNNKDILDIKNVILDFFLKAQKAKEKIQADYPEIQAFARTIIDIIDKETPSKLGTKTFDDLYKPAENLLGIATVEEKGEATSMEDWGTKEDLLSNSEGVGMGEGQYAWAEDKKYILGSGGASDCVIIIAYNAATKKGFAVHAHRKTAMNAIEALISEHVGTGSAIAIYLSSQMFTKEDGKESALINDVKQMIAQNNYNLKQTYSSTSLAINLKNGTVKAGVTARDLGGNPGDNEGQNVFIRGIQGRKTRD